MFHRPQAHTDILPLEPHSSPGHRMPLLDTALAQFLTRLLWDGSVPACYKYALLGPRRPVGKHCNLLKSLECV